MDSAGLETPSPSSAAETKLRGGAALVTGPGSDGIMVTWKDNFDSFYSEVAELGRYNIKPKAPSGRTESKT